MNRDLGVLVPSRDRPHNIADLCRAWDAMTSDAAKLYVLVDADTPRLAEYQDLAEGWDRADRELVVQHVTGGMVAALNKAAVRFAAQHYALGFLGDDHRPRTACWDLEVLAGLRGAGTGVVTGPDGVRTDQLPTWCAMTSDIVRALGYMAPPTLVHMYVDDAWKALGNAIGGFCYLPGVLVEHLHPVAGTADEDEGYRRVNHPGVYARDAAMFARWCREELPGVPARLAQPAGVD